MNFDYNKCPDCGYSNKNQPNICPCCGYDLAVYRRELSEIEKKKQEEEKKKLEEEKRNVPINGTFVKVENAIFFGSYPQTDVTKTMSSVLSSYVSLLPTVSNLNGWVSYKYYIKGSNSKDFMWYKDIIHTDGNKYRAVYFTKYKTYFYSNSSSASTSYQDNNGYSTNTIYWFSYDPIEWNILSEQNGKALIIANLILDSQEYYPNDTESTFSHNGGTGYANNYELSMIRKFLNDNFYNTAFNDLQKGLIETTTVDNSASSTEDSSNSYTCNNTQDKIFLLSYQEATTYYNSDSARVAHGTDYAKVQGLFAENSDGYWWLRSPDDFNGCRVCSVYYDGFLYCSSVGFASNGVRPACYIKLQ